MDKRQFLNQLVGEWTYEFETTEGDYRAKGTERVWAIGEYFIAAESRGEGPDGASHSMMTLGYEPEAKTFSGSFAGTMVPYLWVYSGGHLSADGRELPLETRGPTGSDGKGMEAYRDIIRIINRDRREMAAESKTESGAWKEFMKTTYSRNA